MTYVRLLDPDTQQTTNVILFGANFDDEYRELRKRAQRVLAPPTAS